MTTETREPRRASANGAPYAQLRARIIDSVRHEPSPTRADAVQRHRLVTIATVLVSLGIFIGLGGVRMAPRPSRLVLETASGSLALAIAAVLVGFRRGRSMLGRPRAHLVALALSLPIVLLSWKLLVSSRYADMMIEWPDRPGLRCFLLSGALSVAPLLALHWTRRGSDPIHPATNGAALGAATGAAVWVLVDLWCPVSYVPHLLLGHVLPLLLMIVLSALVGARVLAMRSR